MNTNDDTFDTSAYILEPVNAEFTYFEKPFVSTVQSSVALKVPTLMLDHKKETQKPL